MNLVIITSVINVPNVPLSYSNVRSVFTREERFDQTKISIESVKKFIPNSRILLVECTDFIQDEKEYFENTCDYVVNLWNNKELHKYIFGRSKSAGEGMMTIEGLTFILKNNMVFESLFKLSGRYWINDKFDYSIFSNTKSVFKKINGNNNNISTVFYKLTYIDVYKLLEFLKKSVDLFLKNIGYEIIFGYFIKSIFQNTCIYDNIGISGKVTVCGSDYNG